MNEIASSGWGRLRRRMLNGLTGLCLGLTLVACGGGGGGGGGSDSTSGNDDNSNGGAPAKWTYLVYIAADNTLSDMATLNLNQMKAAQSSQDVRVVVQMEQSTAQTAGANPNTLRGTVSNGTAQLASVGQNLDMGNKQTLSDFIKWGKQHYPADRYAVVLWSHGGGWKADKLARGALEDASSGSLMSIKDIAWALQDAGGVDLVNFDACLMAMYEVAYELRHAAKVMVGSEENIPGTGNPYDKIINRLVANPAQDAATLGQGIAKDYVDFYTAANRDSVTISAIDLTKIDALQTSIKALAKTLIANLAGERLNVQAARDASASYSNSGMNHDLVAFAKGLTSRSGVQLLRTQATEVTTAAQAAVLANQVLVVPGDLPLQGSSGLAIYLPSPNNVSQSELTQYQTAATSNAVADGEQSWSDFVMALITGSGGPGQATTTGAFSYRIEWDNADVDLDLLVNEPQGNWAGPYIGVTSVNGFASADSWDSGATEETYTANSQLQKGAYDVLVRFAGCSKGRSACGATTVRVYRYDPSNNDTAAQLIATRTMSAAPALPSYASFASFEAFLTAVKSNGYGDWLYGQRTTRAIQESAKTQLSLPKPRDKSLPQRSEK